MMSLYNQRINNQLINCCLSLPEKDLHKETHSFFANIISYWNHILFGDLILLNRLAATELTHLKLENLAKFPTPETTQDIYHTKFQKLVSLRQDVDELIISFCEHLTEAECEQVIHYQTTEGESVSKKVADVIQHIFNHQTHHRGQLTCVLSQMDVDYGCMDLPIIVPEGSKG